MICLKELHIGYVRCDKNIYSKSRGVFTRGKIYEVIFESDSMLAIADDHNYVVKIERNSPSFVNYFTFC